MARRQQAGKGTGGTTGFQFVSVKWSESQLSEVRKWVINYSGMGTKAITEVIDRGWKISLSQHPQSGRYLATITDKLNRPGCSKCCFIVEHGDLENAVIGVLYAASELLDDGAIGNPLVDTGDEW